MTELAFMAEALAFIEAHLQAPIAVADMADAAGYSLYHFCRVFNATTHHTPYSYLIRRRLAEAARALVTTDARVIDIAYDYQFNNPETFTRACRRIFGATPSQLRETGVLDPHRLMPPLTTEHLAYLAEYGEDLRPVFVQRQPLHLAGLMIWRTDESAECSALWARFEALLPRCAALSPPPDRYLLRWYPPDWGAHGSVVFVGAALPEPTFDLTSTPLVQKTLPGGPYVRFQHAGPPETLPLLLGYVYHTWLPNSERTFSAPFSLAHHKSGVRTLFFPLSST
jgi:AraC family transcriptional regulator